MLNQQPIEKRISDHRGKLDVHSIFYTIQGEGPFTGRPAVFVRLAGCNLQCPQCDTDYTSVRESMFPSDVLSYVISKNYSESGPKLVVITGGEPFRQDIGEMCLLLMDNGYTVQIETNGTLAPPISIRNFCSNDVRKVHACFIICSPKTGSVNKELQPYICSYKYVLSDGEMCDDGLPIQALDHTANPILARPHVGFKGTVYIQPCDLKDDVKNEWNLASALSSSMKYGHTLQLQLHKLLKVE